MTSSITPPPAHPAAPAAPNQAEIDAASYQRAFYRYTGPRIERQLNTIRLLLWWLGVWLPLIAVAIALIGMVIAESRLNSYLG